MKQSDYPIIEYDISKNVIIDVKHNLHSFEVLPQSCVISFFGESVIQYVRQNNGVACGKLVMETFELPLYKVYINDTYVTLMHGLGSGPYIAGQLEKLIAMGCHKFIICGGCGVLDEGSLRGQIYIPTSAVRDEGTSYHYVRPSREIEMPIDVKKQMTTLLDEMGVNYSLVKTWTTDAMYRETPTSIAFRKKEGCQIVEMECASCYAVAQYKDVPLGMILYAGDDVSGKTWNHRDWKSDYITRYQLIELALQLASLLNL